MLDSGAAVEIADGAECAVRGGKPDGHHPLHSQMKPGIGSGGGITPCDSGVGIGSDLGSGIGVRHGMIVPAFGIERYTIQPVTIPLNWAPAPPD
ncbi:hypothetical protein GCM10010211_28500 [Streptomyces albospinus]|uniref:Uncharacterized protein n=1 Tax=Streptomyces albospinus TaxID=285515 RepID=A0ABQ2UZJ4_9ACTN|nr:hypothetical protein GCM10010211_28500 [Streptomyces albospinus]